MNRVLILTVFIAIFSQPLFAQEQIHIVRKGETLYGIGRKYGIPASELLEFNNISDPTNVAIGTSLKIPGSEKPASGAEIKEYTVVKGDTLYSLARKWGLTVTELRNLNNLQTNHVLQIGDVLKYSSSSAGTVVISPTPNPEPPTNPDDDLDKAGGNWPHPGQRSALSGQLRGVAIKARPGDSITCLRKGKVVWLGPYRGYGQVAFIQTSDDYIYVYGGASEFSIKTGNTVNAGAKIGVVGALGEGKGQVIFMVYKGGRSVDPVTAPR